MDKKKVQFFPPDFSHHIFISSDSIFSTNNGYEEKNDQQRWWWWQIYFDLWMLEPERRRRSKTVKDKESFHFIQKNWISIRLSFDMNLFLSLESFLEKKILEIFSWKKIITLLSFLHHHHHHHYQSIDWFLSWLFSTKPKQKKINYAFFPLSNNQKKNWSYFALYFG